MNNIIILLTKKHTDTLIEQTRTRPQETLEYKMKKQLQTISNKPLINLVGECNWLLGVTSFECKKVVFVISLTKTIRLESLYQGIGQQNLPKKLLTNWINTWSLGLKMILNYKLNKLEKKDTFKKWLLLILSWYIQKRNARRIKRCKIQWYWRYGI